VVDRPRKSSPERFIRPFLAPLPDSKVMAIVAVVRNLLGGNSQRRNSNERRERRDRSQAGARKKHLNVLSKISGGLMERFEWWNEQHWEAFLAEFERKDELNRQVKIRANTRRYGKEIPYTQLVGLIPAFEYLKVHIRRSGKYERVRITIHASNDSETNVIPGGYETHREAHTLMIYLSPLLSREKRAEGIRIQKDRIIEGVKAALYPSEHARGK
jgi:hypothetical protein